MLRTDTLAIRREPTPLNYAAMRIVQAHTANTRSIHGRDGRLHLVEHERELHCMCGRMVAEVLPFLKVRDFGRGDEFCGECEKRLSSREKKQGL